MIAASALAGARCCLVVGYATLVGWHGWFAPGFSPLLVASVGVATFAVAFVSWRLFAPDGSCGPMRGAAAGFLTGLVSHPVTWMVYWTIASLTEEFPGERPGLDALWTFSLFYSFFSLIVFGIFTVPLTTLTGAIVGYLMSKGRNLGQSNVGPDKKDVDRTDAEQAAAADRPRD